MINQASKSKNDNKRGDEEEKIKLAVLESYNKKGFLDEEKLVTALEKIENATVTETTFPVTVIFTGGYTYTIDSDANVESDRPMEVGEVAEYTKTIDGEPASFKNPIIPKGFKAVDTDDAKWGSSDGYNKGLVIEDNDENQFVWVPVDGTNLKYEKHVYETAKVDDTDWANTLDSGNGKWRTYYYRNWEDWTDNGGDSQSVAKYGGFYIGRYEAGIPEDAPFYGYQDGDPYVKTTSNNTGKDVATYTPVCKKGQPAWNYISQVRAKEVSQKMYDSRSAIKCSLIDSYAWDTVTTWMQNSGVNVTDSSSWGNYSNATFSINGLYAIHTYSGGWYPAETYSKGTHSKTNGEYAETATGIIERNKAKNIYDFAGNMYEWTTETGHRDGTTTTTIAVLRGGGFNSYGSIGPACCRYGDYGGSHCNVNVGFRVALYVK